MKVSFVLNCDLYTQKRENGFSLENATMFQIHDLFQNGKPVIVLKTVKRFNIKRSTFIISIKIFFSNWEMLSSSCLIKFWSYFLLSTFTLDKGRDPKNPVFQLCPFLTLSSV